MSDPAYRTSVLRLEPEFYPAIVLRNYSLEGMTEIPRAWLDDEEKARVLNAALRESLDSSMERRTSIFE